VAVAVAVAVAREAMSKIKTKGKINGSPLFFTPFGPVIPLIFFTLLLYSNKINILIFFQ
jgi:hypothetical protein